MIDRKFKFVAVNPCNSKVYTEDNALVLCAKDKAVPAALAAYQSECVRLGCGEEHLESMGLMMVRLAKFQADNADLCKIPDTNTVCEIDRCIGGKIK